MGFTLTEIHLEGFRNHSNFALTAIKGNVFIAGPNASGKSSLLEAVQLLCALESFRTTEWQSLTQKGQESCYLSGLFEYGERIHKVQMTVRQAKREYLFNGKSKRLSDMARIVPIVLFVPDDLALVKGSAEQRRLLVDSLGRRLSANYQKVYSDYSKVIRQRNFLLRERQKRRDYDSGTGSEEAAWNDRLIEVGAALTLLRYGLFMRMAERAAINYQRLSGGELLGYDYLASFQRGIDSAQRADLGQTTSAETVRSLIAQTIEARRAEEYVRGTSLVGPHKDEIIFYIDGQEARGFASQGQQRSIALAIKIAEMELVREISGSNAILLLDDVLSELDASRRNQLLLLSSEATQSFITTTDISVIPDVYLANGTLIELDKPKAPNPPARSEKTS